MNTYKKFIELFKERQEALHIKCYPGLSSGIYSGIYNPLHPGGIR